jgi:hypothetical protein
VIKIPVKTRVINGAVVSSRMVLFSKGSFAASPCYAFFAGSGHDPGMIQP